MRIWAQIFFSDDINLPRIWLEAHGNKQHEDGLNNNRDMAYSSKGVTIIAENKFRLGTALLRFSLLTLPAKVSFWHGF